MAQNRMRPVRENGRHPTPVLAEQAMANRVDAAVDPAEPAELQPAVDRAAAEAKVQELRPG